MTVKNFTFSYKRSDGNEKSAEELGDEIADALEVEGIDPSTIHVTAVEDSCDSPLIKCIPMKFTYVKAST